MISTEGALALKNAVTSFDAVFGSPAPFSATPAGTDSVTLLVPVGVNVSV
ncbi:hypothetical protein [Halocynthiibacter namhaensis]|nr:hypothetical protein [Halocynthiibacter namhaensis]